MPHIIVPIYSYKDLDDRAQNRALSNLLEDWCNHNHLIPDDLLPNYHKALEEVTSLRTPWFIHQAFYDLCRNEIDDLLKSSFYTIHGEVVDTKAICYE